jgi:hypothetical protein
MAVEFISRNKINDEEWNNLLEKIPGGNVYSLSWYMDSLAENWMVARDAKSKNVMLFPYKKKAGLKLIYQPFFSREIVCNLDEKHSPASIIEKLPKDFRQVEFSLRDIRGIDSKKFKVDKWKHQFLSLEDDYSKISKGFHDNAKRSIKKAQKENLKMVLSHDVDAVIDLFRKSKGDEIKEIKTTDYRKLKVLMDTGIKNKKGFCVHVLDADGSIISAGYFFDWNNKLIYLKGSANEKGKKIGAMYFMFDELIKKYAGKKSQLDFGGSRITNVATFYKKFGAEDSEYFFIKHQNLPLYFKMLKAAGKMLGK